MGILHILSQDSHPGLITGRLDVSDQSPLETGAESLIESFHFFWRSVRGKYDLFSCLMQLIEGVEKLFLSRLFSYNKLDIVDEKNVDCAVLVTQPRHGRGISSSDGLDHFIGELF